MRQPRSSSFFAVLTIGLLLTACGGSQAVETVPATALPAEEPTAASAEVAEAAAEVTLPSEARARLEAIAALPHRSEDNRARDQYRNPVETLLFFGAEPDQTILELYPGRGWYSEVLAPFVAGHGQLILGNYDPDGDPEAYPTRLAGMVLEMLDDRSDVFGDVRAEVFVPGRRVTLEEDGSVDLVLSFRNAHGWARNDITDTVMAEVFRVLRPGGTFGLVTHRAAEDADPAEALRLGYLRESEVIAAAERAGFELAERSDVNANPRDTRDHPEGVWTLPPTLRLGDENREHWLSIGESDRMTLRFVKPAAE